MVCIKLLIQTISMPSSSRQAFLLVDGYNVIGAWSSLKATRDRHGLASARLELVEALINYTAVVGYSTQIVFDAHYQNTPSHSENQTPNLSVYYTAFAQTADTYIEKFCADFYHEQQQHQFPRLIVATSDRAQRLTVVGYGAEWMSAQHLSGEVEHAARSVKQKKTTQKKISGSFFASFPRC